MKNIRKVMVSAAVLLSGIGQAGAEEMLCTPSPDCAELGYTQSEADCNEKAAVRCPFDTSRLYCKDTPVVEGCGVGSYLYTDKSCSKELDTTRTLVGIVFDPVKKLAMQANYTYSFPYFYFVTGNGITSTFKDIEFCSPAAALNNCATDGKVNTRLILKNRVYPYYWNYDGYWRYNSFLELVRKETCQVVGYKTVMQKLPVEDENGNYVKDADEKIKMVDVPTQELFVATVDCVTPYYSTDVTLNTIPDDYWYGSNHWFIPSLKDLDTIYKNKDVLMNANTKFMYYLGKDMIVTSSTVNDHEKILGYNFKDGVAVAIQQSSISSVYTLPIVSYADKENVLQCSNGYTIYTYRYLTPTYRYYCVETDENGCLAMGKTMSCEYLGVGSTSGSYNSTYQLAVGTDYEDLVAKAEALPETNYGYFVCRHCVKGVYRLFDNQYLRKTSSQVTLINKKSN